MLNGGGLPAAPLSPANLEVPAPVDPSAFPWLAEALAALLERRDLSEAQVRGVMQTLMSGSCGEAEAAAFLVALRMKGETAAELATAAAVLREQMVRFDPGRPCVL